jgi:hypothetical protein
MKARVVPGLLLLRCGGGVIAIEGGTGAAGTRPGIAADPFALAGKNIGLRREARAG